MGSDPKISQVSMVTIGQQLKEAREKKSVTIDQVEKQTRIHSTVLRALEDGRCDEILTPTYVRSFLKKYAEYLGLDIKQLLSEYAKLGRSPSSSIGSIMSRMEDPGHLNLSRFFGRSKKALVIAVGVLLVVMVGWKLSGIVKRSLSTAASKPVGIARESEVSKKKAAAKTVKAKTQKAPVSRVPSKAVRQDDTGGKIAIPAPEPISNAVPIKLIIVVNQPVRIKISVDGAVLFDTVLPQGIEKSITADERINIYTAKAEAMELILNGKSLGSPGRGPIKNIEITRKGLRIK